MIGPLTTFNKFNFVKTDSTSLLIRVSTYSSYQNITQCYRNCDFQNCWTPTPHPYIPCSAMLLECHVIGESTDVYTLNLKRSTSPSCNTYSFPSERSCSTPPNPPNPKSIMTCTLSPPFCYVCSRFKRTKHPWHRMQ